jgi:hypothetical protein
MKTQVLKLLLLLFFLVNALSVFAVVSEYSFTSILGHLLKSVGGLFTVPVQMTMNVL